MLSGSLKILSCSLKKSFLREQDTISFPQHTDLEGTRCYLVPSRYYLVPSRKKIFLACHPWASVENAANGMIVKLDVCILNSDWYLAAEGMFAGALILLQVALVVQTLFACCHCWLHRSCAPTTVASLTIATGMTDWLTRIALYIQACIKF